MIICKTAELLHQSIISLKKNDNATVGFVPTMGALHQGHISLIEASIQKTDIIVCSIFVNPTQFNDVKDFEKYPITIEQDIYLLEQAGCNILFLPNLEEIYPEGLNKLKHYDLGYLEEILEGKYRKGHFQGVCNVVERLLNIVKPTILFLGQKDYQQCMVIKKLIEIMNWQNKLSIKIIPTKRELRGLAMSSRNKRLNETEKENATAIYKSLEYIKNNFYYKPLTQLKDAKNILNKSGFDKIDYISICRVDNLLEVEKIGKKNKHIVLIAAFLGEVRLIDNILID
ncbi:MAG: pantoate--beta-alanine ligase [Chitinophagales bacterium]|nr:pantoate--beta-alanine ligase [Chitinophagales bacterium]